MGKGIHSACFQTKFDNYLNLKSTLDRKLKQAAATIGPETKPIPEAPTSSIIFGLKKKILKYLNKAM